MSKPKPRKLNVLGVTHDVQYQKGCPSEHGEWGSYDEYARLITVNDTPDEFERWHIMIHEVLHAIEAKLKLTSLASKKGHEELDLFAMGITDFLFRNKLLKETK